MKEKEKIKLFDFLINNIENSEMFDIDNILTKHKKVSDDDIRDCVDDLNSFGIKHNIFEKVGTDIRTSWLKLTPKGEKLKSFKNGFVKFENNSTKTPLTLFEKLSIIGFIITFFYGYFQNNELNKVENQRNDLNTELDTLKKEFYYLNKKSDSLFYELKKMKQLELEGKELK